MKLLVIDVGNTSTAVGLWSRGRVSNVVHIDTGVSGAQRAAEDILGFARKGARGTMGTRGTIGVDGVAYVSVVPKVDASWRRWAKSHKLRLHQISHTDVSLKNCSHHCQPRPHTSTSSLFSLDYPHPETIGSDRICDAVSAVSRYGAPVLVMDFGTALTAAIVTRDRVWRGGVIAPGFPLMRDYLFERTAKLPRMTMGSGRAPKIGRSTEEAMRFGALVGYRGMVREIVATLRKNFHEDFRLVATGGFAKWVLRDLDLPFTIDSTLTLNGAGLICARCF